MAIGMQHLSLAHAYEHVCSLQLYSHSCVRSVPTLPARIRDDRMMWHAAVLMTRRTWVLHTTGLLSKAFRTSESRRRSEWFSIALKELGLCNPHLRTEYPGNPQKTLQTQKETPRKQGDTMSYCPWCVLSPCFFSESLLGFGVSSGESRDSVAMAVR